MPVSRASEQGAGEQEQVSVLIDIPAPSDAIRCLRAMPRVHVSVIESPEEHQRALPAEVIQNIEILFCTHPPTNFEDMKAVKLIQIASVGYAQLIGLGLAGTGVRACNSRGVFDVPIAEWNMAMMVSLARNLRGMIRNQESQIWDRSAVFQREIRGSTVGIWGYGGIGRESARLAKAFGMNVHVMSRRPVRPRSGAYVVPGASDSEGVLADRQFIDGQELEFLAGLDFLILALPLTKQTEGLIGERQLQALPRTSFVLNPARGPIIQEHALLRALNEGWIAGAALDTHYHYPMPPNHPLWRFPNVIFTPHISGSSLSPHFRERIWEIFLNNVDRYLNGQPLLNELTREELCES
jgi:phosphoglycerate dehydrogenase-like enzyme